MEADPLAHARSGLIHGHRLFQLALFLSLLLVAAIAFGGGQGEDPLFKARELVTEKKYDEAIRILAEIVRRDPDKMDAVEALMREIRAIRDAFNKKYENLLAVLYEEKNVDKALVIINELLTMDPNPNQAAMDAIEKARRGALVVSNKNHYNRIMDEALLLLQKGEFTTAAQTYLPGFEIHKEEFDNAGYGAIVQASIDGNTSKVQATTVQFIQRNDGFETAAGQVETAAGEGNTASFPPLLGSFLTRMQQLGDIKRTYQEIADIFKTQNQKIQEMSKDQLQDYFLYYATGLLEGRKDRNVQEGLISTVALLMETTSRRVEEQIARKADSLSLTAIQDYRDGGYEQTSSAMAAAEQYYSALMRLAYMRESGKTLDENYRTDSNENIMLDPKLQDFIRAQEKLRQTLTYRTLAENMGGLDSLKVSSRALTPSDLETVRVTVAGSTEAMDSLATDWHEYQNLLSNADQAASEAAGAMVEVIVEAIYNYLATYQGNLNLRFADIKDRFLTEKDKLISGERITVTRINEKNERVAEERTVRYPGTRGENLTKLRQDIEALDGYLNWILSRWSPKAETVVRSDKISAVLGVVEEMIAGAQAIEGEFEGLLGKATQDRILAERYQKEGEASYGVADARFKAKAFNDARENLRLAAESLDSSLEYRENPEVRNLRDVVLPAFLTRINQTENAEVVREVRDLIDRGKQWYRDGRYFDAEDLLVRAQSRWRDTNPTDNEEVLDWLTLVRRAINYTKGWEILVTDPLYAEVTQLLKFAAEDYNKGVKMLEVGKQGEATQYFNSSKDKLATIRIPFPQLKLANSLQLKIIRLVDPNEFRRQFANIKSRAAVALRNGDLGTIQQDFSILKEYEQVEPRDRELVALLTEFEYALGLKIRPPSQGDIAKSRANYETARGIYDNRQRDLYSRAVELLTEAVKLWPDNKQAALLKDRILIDTGGARQDIISSDDSKKLETAEKLFNERNYAESYNIVQVLLRNPTNRNYPRLLDLEEKLKRRLGIP